MSKNDFEDDKGFYKRENVKDYRPGIGGVPQEKGGYFERDLRQFNRYDYAEGDKSRHDHYYYDPESYRAGWAGPDADKASNRDR